MKFKYKNTGQIFDFTKADLKKGKKYLNPKWLPLCDEGAKLIKELKNPKPKAPKKKVNTASVPEKEATKE